MQNVTRADQQRPRRTVRKKRWRLSQAGKFRLFFIALLLVLFGASYGITSLVLLSAPVSADLPEPPPETETPQVEVSVPEPVTDPKLPTILTGLTVTENDEPPLEADDGKVETEGEESTEEPSQTESEGGTPTEEDPAEEEEPTAGSREEGLR